MYTYIMYIYIYAYIAYNIGHSQALHYGGVLEFCQDLGWNSKLSVLRFGNSLTSTTQRVLSAYMGKTD